MAKESGWPQTVEIFEIDGIPRPGLSKQLFAKELRNAGA